MSFGDVIRSANSPSVKPSGIGGNANITWHCDFIANKVYELSTTNFSTIRSANSPGVGASGIGGDANTIWHCDFTSDIIYELSTTDFSTVRSVPSPSLNPYGIGGDANTIWLTIKGSQYNYELSTTDFSIIKSAPCPSVNPHGMGGDANTIWHSNPAIDLVYELLISDFSVVKSASTPAGAPTGIGGDINTIWHCDYSSDRIYELDANANLPPVADAGGPYTGNVGSNVSFDGSGSTDVDGTIVLYEWDFGDSETGVGVNANHIYTVANTYTVVLTVTDDGGLTDNDTTSATISEAVIEGIPDVFTFGRIGKKRRHRIEV